MPKQGSDVTSSIPGDGLHHILCSFTLQEGKLTSLWQITELPWST
jgi:hypothetical protein